MTPSPLPEPLRVLQRAWLSVVRGPRRRAIIAASCLAVTAAMLVARMGTTSARLGALAVVVVTAAAIVTWRIFDERVFKDPARTIERVAGGVEPELAGRAVRALSLLRPEANRGASSELANLHVTRT